MYEEILLPTDGSPGMGSTIEQCFHQATQNAARVHALYVVDVRSFVMLPDETAEHVADLLQQDGTRALEAVQTRAEDADLEIVTELATGVPHDAILAYAEEHDIDLIVMGTHGRSGDAKRVVGSVAEEVVRNAQVPVLTVRMSEGERQQVKEEIPEEQLRYIR